MATSSDSPMFPCPVCAGAREVRLSKKDKPYIVCDPCGIQIFVRGPAGIAEFNRLVNQAKGEDLWTRLKEMQRRYRLKCHKCDCHFWIEPELIKTSLING